MTVSKKRQEELREYYQRNPGHALEIMESLGIDPEEVLAPPQQPQQEGSLAEAAFTQILNVASAIGMLEDPRVTTAFEIIHMDPEDEKTIAEVYREVMDFLQPEHEIAKMYESPFDPLPIKENAAGDIHLGTVVDARAGKTIGPHDSWPVVEFGLRFPELNQHTLILGRSGSGKTTLITNMLFELIKQDVPCWVIDLHRDYRGIANVFKDVLVIRWEQFKFNPLRPPPGVSPRTWTTRFTDITCEAMVGFRGAKNIMQRHIKKLFKEYDVLNTDIYPTLHDLYQDVARAPVKKLSFREQQHVDTAKSILELTSLGLEEVLDCDEGYPIDALLEKHVIFELDGLSGELETLFINLLLGWILVYRIASGEREGVKDLHAKGHNLRNVIIFDEAKTVFDARKEQDRGVGVPYISKAATTVRKFGVGLIVADQMWSWLAKSITSNVFTKICLSCHPDDMGNLVRYMGLDGENQVMSFQNQAPFQAIIKLAGGRHIHPFQIQFGRFDYPKEMDDVEIEIRAGEVLDQLGWKPAEKPKTEAPEPETEEEKVEEPVEPFVYSDAGRVLNDICDHPFSAVTERYFRLGLSADKGNTTVEHLKRNELVKKAHVDFGRGGGKVVLLTLTDKGCEVINRKPKVPGKGGIEHRYCQHRAFEIYRALGYVCEFEAKHSDEGESIDLLAQKNDEAIGIEIELGTDINQPIQNVRKCLNHGCTKVVVISKTTLRNKLRKELPNYFSDDKVTKVELKQFSFLAPGAEERQQDIEFTPSETAQTVETEREPVKREIVVEPDAPPFVMPEAGKVKVYLGHDLSKKGKKGWTFWEPLAGKPKKIPNPHIMILGTSGAGKTQTLMALVYELYRQKVPSIIFDFHGEYADEEFRNMFEATVIDPLEGVNINPLEIPNNPSTGEKASPVQLVSEVTEIIDGIYRLGVQQKALFRKAIYYSLDEAGISKDNPETWNNEPPGFETLDLALNHYETLGDKVASKLRSKISELFETGLFSAKEPLPIELLLKGVSILNLQSLFWDTKLQVTMSRFFLKKIYNEMIKRRETKGIRMFCIIDEAHKVTSDPIIEALVREARKYGLGLILASHMPKDFHEAVFSNTATKIVLKLEKEDHAREIIKHLGTFERKEKEALRSEILSQDTLHAFLVNNHYLPYARIKVRPYFERVKKKD